MSPNNSSTVLGQIRSNLFYRLLAAGIIIFLGFYVGSISIVKPHISKVEIRNIYANVNQVISTGLDIYFESKSIKVTGEEIRNWTYEYIRDYSGQKDFRIDTNKVRDYVNSLAGNIELKPISAKFEINEGKVSEFQPSSFGKKVQIEDSVNNIVFAIRDGQSHASLAVQTIEPEITLDKINSLGITTLIGRGESNFAGSSQARIHNIKVGMGKFNGIILRPGEQFSFNAMLGEVDEKNGYQPELVIKNKKTVLEYGGGICQVSTTLFRSAIYAGLPIVERKPHSFPVRYYSPQGFDATIYPGITDLKFVNDTPNHMLIQNKIIGTKLIFEIYGSSDERIVKIDGPYQYDQKPSGAMKAYFARIIAYPDGTEKKERFNSIYTFPPSSQERNPLE